MNFYPEGSPSERDWEGAKLNLPFRNVVFGIFLRIRYFKRKLSILARKMRHLGGQISLAHPQFFMGPLLLVRRFG